MPVSYHIRGTYQYLHTVIPSVITGDITLITWLWSSLAGFFTVKLLVFCFPYSVRWWLLFIGTTTKFYSDLGSKVIIWILQSVNVGL